MEILQDICLVCLQVKEGKISLFDKTEEESPYEKLVKYTRFNVKPYNGPAWICKACLDELCVIEKFEAKCEQANEVLLDYFNSENDVTNKKGASDDEDQEYNGDSFNTNNYTTLDRRGTQSSKANNNPQNEVFHRRVCPVSGCHKSFTSKTNLLTHVRRHNGERPFPCCECGKTFRSKNTLNNHMRIHTGVKPYMCPTCGKQFSTNKLSAHMRTHAARTHACPVCARAFTHTRALLLHTRTHAPPTHAYVCVLCDVRYNHKQSLNKHMRKRHAQKSVTDG